MEQNFQTSFIPKKPMIEERTVSRRPISFLLILSIFIFFIMILISGGAYFYRDFLTKDLTKMKNDLELAKNRFEPSLINKLTVLDKRLNSSSEILSQHVVISPIFKTLQELTLKTLRYTKFGYELTNNKVVVKMSGQASSYRSIALQADLFTKDKNLIDPVFSNLSLSEKGDVLFDLEFSVDPTFVNYKQMKKTEVENIPAEENIIDNLEPIN